MNSSWIILTQKSDCSGSLFSDKILLKVDRLYNETQFKADSLCGHSYSDPLTHCSQSIFSWLLASAIFNELEQKRVNAIYKYIVGKKPTAQGYAHLCVWMLLEI